MVQTARRRDYGIENVALVKVVWLGLKLVGLLGLFYSRTFLVFVALKLAAAIVLRLAGLPSFILLEKLLGEAK